MIGRGQSFGCLLTKRWQNLLAIGVIKPKWATTKKEKQQWWRKRAFAADAVLPNPETDPSSTPRCRCRTLVSGSQSMCGVELPCEIAVNVDVGFCWENLKTCTVRHSTRKYFPARFHCRPAAKISCRLAWSILIYISGHLDCCMQ